MRLLRFGHPGAERPGLLVPDEPAEDRANVVYDVSSLVGDYDAAFWSGGGLSLMVRDAKRQDLPVIDLGDVRLGPPIPRPSKILCIGLNYRDHAAESATEVPTEPVVFMKAPNTIVGPNDDVVIPPRSVKTDWEVELGVVIGRRARYLADIAAARTVIGGYVLSNDVSEREFQLERGGQWAKGKSCETFNPLGPYLVTADEIPDPQQLRLWLDVNDQRMQDGTTADMVFPVDYLVWYLSQFMVLEPGDLINTGTPAGVGLGSTPQRYLEPGDTMTLGADQLGRQHLRCVPVDVPWEEPMVKHGGFVRRSTAPMTAKSESSRRAEANEGDGGPLFQPAVRAGDFLFVSGQASVDEAGTFVPGTFAEQMHRSIENVRRILADAGLTLADVVKVNAYVHDPADAAEYNRLYKQYLAKLRPARTTLASCLNDQIKFEIDVIAYLPDGRGPADSAEVRAST